MALLFGVTVGILAVVAILIISALPLYFAVKFLGGKATIFKVLMVNLIVGVIGAALDMPVIGFVLLLFVYKEVFKMSWLSAFLAWILQFAVACALLFLALFLSLGVAVL